MTERGGFNNIVWEGIPPSPSVVLEGFQPSGSTPAKNLFGDAHCLVCVDPTDQTTFSTTGFVTGTPSPNLQEAVGVANAHMGETGHPVTIYVWQIPSL